jgi:predicted phosphoribosyltransferase
MTNVNEITDLHDVVHPFRNRAHAGRVLADMLEAYRDKAPTILGIPAGGVPVAAEIARIWHVSLCACTVSKMTPPWNSEVGYGAVAFDGTVMLNEQLVQGMHLTDETIEEGIAQTRDKVRHRAKLFHTSGCIQGLPHEGTGILVDDGLASGFTMQAAIKALRKTPLSRIVVAVPTAPQHTVDWIAEWVDTLYCANVRSGPYFAVAGAYQDWSDVSEEEALALIKAFEAERPEPNKGLARGAFTP